MKKLPIDYSIFGSLIEYYRNEEGLTRKDFVKLSSNHFSYTTLRRMEKGEYASFDNYLRAAEILNLKISSSLNAYTELNSLIEETYSIINSGKQLTEYILLKNKINKFAKKYFNYFYIYDISKLCISSLEMYLSYKKPNKKIIDISEKCFVNGTCFKINDISYILLFMYAIYYLRGSKNFDKYIKYYKMINNERITLLNNFFYDFSASDILSTYTKHCINKQLSNDSPIDLFIYNFANAYTNAYVKNYYEAKEYIDSALSIRDIQLIIPKGLMMHAYITKGYIEYNLKKYKQSYDCFLKVYETNSIALEIGFIFLFKTAELTNNTKTIYKIIRAEEENSMMITNIFNYYKNKYINGCNEKELSKYIVDNFSLEKCKSKILAHFFLNELFIMTKTTKQYKIYYDFAELNYKQFLSLNKDVFID